MCNSPQSVRPCPHCGAGGKGILRAYFLGTLGSTTWVRCRMCGGDFTLTPEQEDSEDAVSTQHQSTPEEA